MEKKVQQQALFFLLISAILLVGFLSQSDLSGRAVDRGGARAFVSSPPSPLSTDSTDEGQSSPSTSMVTGLPDSECALDITKCVKCPCEGLVTCEANAFSPGKKCTSGGVAAYMRELCQSVVADANKLCLASTDKCPRAASRLNYRCEGVAGVATPGSNNGGGECEAGKVREPLRDDSGQIRVDADRFLRYVVINGIVVSCTSSCTLHCSEVEIR